MATFVDSFNSQSIQQHMYTMLAAFAGVLIGVLGSMGFLSSFLQSQFAAQTDALDKRIVNAAPASDVSACVVPSSEVGGRGADAAESAKVAHAAAVVPHDEQPGGRGADDVPHAPFVQQMISGAISNTGPNSSNSINATNNFNYSQTNNNSVSVSNSNTQTSSSGSANVSDNTNAGSAHSGGAANHNSTSTGVSISN